jgi:tetratricopeptide (TPR) repeat protein
MHRDEAGSADFELERILRQEMQDLLASPYFARSPVQCRLLRYLVEHRLRGDLPAPKAYAIATQALGRPADFDPSTDSYPRVMVGRLRTLLERYYGEKPWLHRLRIPQGSYEVVVQYRASPPSRSGGVRGDGASLQNLSAKSAAARPASGPIGFSPANIAPLGSDDWDGVGGFDSLSALLDRGEEALPPSSPPSAPLPETRWDRLWAWLDEVLPQPNKLRRWMVIVAAVSIAAMLGGAVALLGHWYANRASAGGVTRPSASYQAYVPLPLVDVQVRAAAAHDPSANAVAAAVRARLRDSGRRFEMVSVMGGDAAGDGEAKPDYRVEVLLSPAAEGQMHAVFMVHRVADQRSIWSRRYRIGPEDGPDFASLDPAIVQIAGNYGVIVRDQTIFLANDYSAGFPCLAQYQRVRIAQRRDAVEKVAKCVAETVALNPRDPVGLSASSYMLHHVAAREHNAEKAKELRRKSLAAAEAAYAADPASAHAAFAQTRAYFTLGRCPASLGLARRAEDGNPLDADMLSRLAIIYQMCGDGEQASRLSERALSLDQAFPAVPLMARASVLLTQGRPQQALDQLAGMANLQPVTAHYHVLQSLALAQLGRRAEAQEHWNRLIALAGMPENARAEDVLRHFSAVDVIVRREAAMLRDAGVVTRRTAN